MFVDKFEYFIYICLMCVFDFIEFFVSVVGSFVADGLLALFDCAGCLSEVVHHLIF